MSKAPSKKLGDYFTLQRGFDITKKEQFEGKYPVVSSSGITSYHCEYKVKGPGVVIGRKGSLGTAFYIEKNYWPHDTTLWIKDFKGNYPLFLYYFIKELPLQRLDSGSSNPTLNRNFVHLIEGDIPALDSQKKIAAILSVLDAKIDINNRINAELDAMSKTLYDYWFVQFDFPISKEQAESMGNPALEGKPYKTSGGKMVYNSTLKRRIPDGWKAMTLSDIANIIMGQSPSGDSYNEKGLGTIFFQGSTDFGWLFPSTRQYTTSPARMAKKGDILLSVRAPVGAINIANNDCCIGRGLAALNSKYGFDGFLFYVMKYFKQIFDRRNTEGTTFGSITKNDLHSLPLAYPSSKLLKRYDKVVSKYNELTYMKSMENISLTNIRDWLLPMLMNGQITVK